MEHADVVIVGAGIAGLGCARELAGGGLSVVVLEARDRVGGRVQSARLAGERPVELGAQVIHGDRGPIWPHVADAGIHASPLTRAAELRFAVAGAGVPAEAVLAEAAFPPWEVDEALTRNGRGERSAAEALDAFGLTGAARTVALEWLTQTWSADPDELSLAGLRRARDAWRAGPGEFVAAEGLDRLPQQLARGLDVRLSRAATAIRLRPDAVEVETAEVAWRARAAVVTVPPRVLAAGAIDFDPPLGQRRLHAAGAVGVGDALVLVAHLREHAPASAVAVVAGGGFWRCSAGSPLLTGVLKGRAAARARAPRLDRAFVAQLTAPALTWMRAGLVDELLVADWGADPLALGCHSYPRRSALDCPALLARPVDGALFFAGEATCANGARATIDSAFASGLRAAGEVAAAFDAATTPARAAAPPYDPFSEDVRRDPYPAYERLRAQGPLRFESEAAMWLVVGHAECLAVLRDQRFSARLGQQGRTPLRASASSMLTTDEPDHTRLRAPLARMLSARAAEQWRARAAAIVAELLDRLGAPARFDVVADIARPLSIRVLAELLAVPPDDLDFFHERVRAASRVLDPLAPADAQDDGERAAETLEEYLSAVAARRRRQPGDDLLGTLVRAVDDEGALSWPELLMTCELLALGGYEPTVHAIANGTHALLRAGDQLAALRAGVVEPAAAVEELLRFESPVQFAARAALADVELARRTIRSGERVVCLLGAANRDPAVFREPARLDLSRAPNRHLAFGGGIHFCLGAALTRAVTTEAIGALAARFASIQRTGPEPEWLATAVPRGLRTLVVEAA